MLIFAVITTCCSLALLYDIEQTFSGAFHGGLLNVDVGIDAATVVRCSTCLPLLNV